MNTNATATMQNDLIKKQISSEPRWNRVTKLLPPLSYRWNLVYPL